MNIYFLVEGRRTEMKVYPNWLSYLLPDLQRVDFYQNANTNNYYMFSGNGFPSLLRHLQNCVDDINSAGIYDYFVVCLDADEQTTEACKQEILDFMIEENVRLNIKTKFKIIVQNKCIETWFLGNTTIFKKNPTDDFLKECVKFYNVKENDPELMGKIPDFTGSTSDFHSTYLQKLLHERNIKYSKTTPHGVREEYFLKNLIKRSQQTRHIPSFQTFIDFCNTIKTEIRPNTQN